MKKLCVIGIGFFALGACNQATDHSEHRKDGFSATAGNPEDSLYQLVMDGHDEAMAKMGKLRGYQQASRNALDSLVKAPASEAREKWTVIYKNLQEELNYAEYSMNTWMEEFNPDSSKDNKDQRLDYLKKEHDKVEKVKTNILSTIRKADSLTVKK